MPQLSPWPDGIPVVSRRLVLATLALAAAGTAGCRRPPPRRIPGRPPPRRQGPPEFPDGLAGNQPRLYVRPSSFLKAGERYSVMATGFQLGENVRFRVFYGRSQLDYRVVAPQSSGTVWPIFAGQYQVGSYTVTATGMRSGRTASAWFQVGS